MIVSICFQERAFLGLSTLRDLIIKKPQGNNEFLQVLLDITMSEIELVSLNVVTKGLIIYLTG